MVRFVKPHAQSHALVRGIKMQDTHLHSLTFDKDILQRLAIRRAEFRRRGSVLRRQHPDGRRRHRTARW
ncbi:MAG: hypothetical protein MZV64_02265 [Ignavibacteriales bacterium]|nr:hypothetical protein [Ignavibacteriales bacterium]